MILFSFPAVESYYKESVREKQENICLVYMCVYLGNAWPLNEQPLQLLDPKQLPALVNVVL